MQIYIFVYSSVIADPISAEFTISHGTPPFPGKPVNLWDYHTINPSLILCLYTTQPGSLRVDGQLDAAHDPLVISAAGPEAMP